MVGVNILPVVVRIPPCINMHVSLGRIKDIVDQKRDYTHICFTNVVKLVGFVEQKIKKPQNVISAGKTRWLQPPGNELTK